MKISDETRKLVESMMKESGVTHRKAQEIKQVSFFELWDAIIRDIKFN
jgi:hypothetical protein